MQIVQTFGQVERQARLTQISVRLSRNDIADIHFPGGRYPDQDIRLHILIEAGEGDLDRTLFAGIGQALLLPIAVGGQELPGALTHFGSSQMVQVDVEMQERAFLDDDLSLGGRVADQAGFFGERDLETVSFNRHHTGGFLYLQHTVYRRCFRIGKANVVIAAQ